MLIDLLIFDNTHELQKYLALSILFDFYIKKVDELLVNEIVNAFENERFFIRP